MTAYLAEAAIGFAWPRGDVAFDPLIHRQVALIRSDGEEALDYLYSRGKFKRRSSDNPAVLLLDLKLPKGDGLEVLRTVKSDDALTTP